MNLLRNSSRSITRVSQAASLTRRPDCRLFSTEAQAAQLPNLTATFDPFHRSPPSGTVYARLDGITKHTTKSDVVDLLSGSNLRVDDIKHEYNLSFIPIAALVRFPSRQDFDAGIRSISKRGYRLDREIDSFRWDNIIPYDGKAVLLQRIPRNALPDDISRFLAGCPHDSSSIQVINRSSSRVSIVGFPSQALAMNAYITKNQEFCLNKKITMRVLY